MALACASVVACSSEDGQPGASLPQFDTSSTVAESDGASPDTGGTSAPTADENVNPEGVTAESLSSPETEYYVTAIPEHLSLEQTEVLVAYINYSRATWEAYRSMDGMTEVEAVTTGEALDEYTESYTVFSDGNQHIEGGYSVTVNSVEVNPGGTVATIGACVDQTQVQVIDAQGTDVTDRELKKRVSSVITVDRVENGWIVSASEKLGAGQC